MTTLLGVLVGTPASKPGFPAISNRFANGSDHILVRDYVTLNGNLIGDLITLGAFKSTAFIDPAASIYWGACGAGCTLAIGDVNHPAGLAAAFSVTNAGSGVINTNFAPQNMGMPLWQKLGYASDPGGNLTLLGIFAGANPNNVSIAWKIPGQNS